jgi:catalase
MIHAACSYPRLARAVVLGAWLAIALGARPAGAEDAVSPEVGAVDALQALFGKHPGVRINHAKGVVLEGTFTPASEAAGVSKAALFAGPPTKAVVRFSDPTGIPDIDDDDPTANPHGMAVKFTLADKSEMDMAMISSKVFPVASAAEFRDLFLAIGATKPDSPKPTPVEKFFGAHPAAVKFAQMLPKTPASLAQETYYGLNAYRLVDKAGKVTNVRFRFAPVAGEARLSAEDLAKKGANFLMDDIKERAKAGTAKFKLVVQVAAKDDKTNDVTVNWPDDRPLVTLGELAITAPVADSAAIEKTLLYMPGQLIDGIEASDDPMIQSRNAAYAESFGRRSQ